jgi:hypothetical protein
MVIDALLNKNQIEEQSYRSCMVILQFSKEYGTCRLEGACKRAWELSSPYYRTIYNILKNKQDLTPQGELFTPVLVHENLRPVSSFA